MARIRLRVVNTPVKLTDLQGKEVTIDSRRIHCVFFIGTAERRQLREGLIDTGTVLSVFPERQWRTFESEIEWLTDNVVSRLARLAGGEYAFRLGRIAMTAMQADLSPQLASISLTAQFIEDNEKLSHALLGIGGGFLFGRRLILEPDLREAWLEEVPSAEGEAN